MQMPSTGTRRNRCGRAVTQSGQTPFSGRNSAARAVPAKARQILEQRIVHPQTAAAESTVELCRQNVRLRLADRDPSVAETLGVRRIDVENVEQTTGAVDGSSSWSSTVR